uniref:UBA domain-containing protein n=2 Tax=Arion vulgaris TaxID=1028688 RepID=A0A0B6ZRP9_9EUPU
MTALETTQWDVTKATKYLQLKKLLSLGVADVYKCKEALTASGWNLQCAAEALLESSRAPGVPSRRSPAKPGMITSHNRPATPEIVDV